MSLIVYATQNPFTTFFTFMASITIVKDIMIYGAHENIFDSLYIFFYRFARDNLYITESLKSVMQVSNTSHAAIHVLLNIVGFQITTGFYAMEFAVYALIRGSILAYQATSYVMTSLDKTYEHAQHYLTHYEPSSYSLTYWIPSYEQIDYMPQILSCLTGFAVIYIARQMTVKPVQKEKPVEPLIVKASKETIVRRRSPRLAMLYLTDHNLSSST